MRVYVAITIALTTVVARADQIGSPTQFSKVRDQIQAYVDDGDAPSVAVAVIQNDKLIWAEGFGSANLEDETPATADTIYRLASISKSFTATGLMVLKDRELVDLDAPANRYLPGQKLRSYVGSADQITIRSLANHTSGLPLHYNFFYPGSKPPEFDVTLRRYGFAYRKPGTYWEYSNLAYGVLDQVIGNVSKVGWPAFMEQEVYGPLGMTRTSDHVRQAFAADAAVQYGTDVAGRFSPVLHYDFDHPGASAVVSSTNDMARYARMHLNNGILDGVRVLSEESALEMRRPTSFAPGRNLGYGVAFNDGKLLGQATNSSSGGMPGVSTTLRLFPDDNSAVIVLTNGEDHAVTTGVMTAIAKVLYPEGEDDEADNAEPAPESLEKFLGPWKGTVLRDGVPIPFAMNVTKNGDGTIDFEGGKPLSLQNVKVKDEQFVADTEGRFVVSHPYQGSSNIYVRLRRDGDRLTGRLSALEPAYFALSHWVELEQENLSEQLHAAAKAGDAKSIRDLLQRGAEVDSPSKYQATALSFAAQHGNLEVVQLLLEHDAKVNVRDTFYGLSPVYWAASKGHSEIVKALLDGGADNLLGALDVSCKRGHGKTTKAILSKVKFAQNELSDILIGDPYLQPDVVTLLTEAGANADRKPPILLKQEELESFAGTYTSPDELLYEVTVRGPRLEISSDGRLIHIIGPRGPTEFRRVGDEKTSVTFEVSDDVATAMRIARAEKSIRYLRLESKATEEKWNRGDTEQAAVVRSPKNWPSFRGPGASGVADGQHPPVNWNVDTGENIRWKTEIPGLGHSCPIIWDDSVFLTSAVSGGGDHSLRTGQYGDIDSVADGSEHIWRLHCLDKTNGAIRWTREIHRGVPKVKRHLKSTHANPTPATDGEKVVVSLGSEGLFCFNFDGEVLWKRDLGKLASGWFYDDAFEWGFGSSPIIYRDLVIQQCDVGKDSFIAAYDLASGEQVWRTERDENPSWSSPTVYVGPNEDELITAASNFVRGYDPLTGEERWRLARLAEVTIPTPVVANGLVYVTSGYRAIKPIYAIRPGGSGDITLADGETSNEFVAWKLERGGPYMPTPVVYQGHLYVCPNNGLLSCYDAKTGERTYRKRLKNKNGYTASPVAADGKIYFISESGEVTVIRAGSEFELLAKNEMGTTCMATPAISDGMIFVRTQNHLYGIGAMNPVAATGVEP